MTNITILISDHLQCQLAVVMLPVLGAAQRLPHEHDVDGRPAHCGHGGSTDSTGQDRASSLVTKILQRNNNMRISGFRYLSGINWIIHPTLSSI